MSLHDFESSCHFYFKNKYDEKILYNYNYVDFPLCIESAENGSCHWVYMYIHVLLINWEWVLMYWPRLVNTSRPQSEISL